MEPVETDTICPKCGERMLLLPDTEWSLFELHTVEMICPNCVHVETIETIVARRTGETAKLHHRW